MFLRVVAGAVIPLAQWRYFSGMRVKTSVTLPDSLLAEIDRRDGNRSAFLERAAVAFLARATKDERDAKDAAILEQIGQQWNEESDALEYQGLPE